MIHTPRQLKALVRNLSKGNSAKAQMIIRTYVICSTVIVPHGDPNLRCAHILWSGVLHCSIRASWYVYIGPV